ncbi:NFX1-type zinc finger-containing protein 1-like [Daphnia carinata]|uniref:NFX1-type zinc finger-containing protein 1-like n=1 Tax=Daphnia carinata TaxID=120202 RepID=UPI00257A0948|nr:NFX1-type zinc finger-containing protein 1-like [Daphnia carinata]XP_057380710.1 NFX1-type zinc finger-containing protein 1-like [Daphnia carinata]
MPGKKVDPPQPASKKKHTYYVPSNKPITIPPTADFRLMHLMPLITDLLSNADATTDEFLKPNCIRKPYLNVDTYLETHFRLLWADFIQPLRDTIGKFCKGNEQVPPDKPNQQIHFYRNVSFIENSFLSSQSVPDKPDAWRRYHVRFDSMPGFDWEKSKRLIHGTLVCLWNAPSRLIILATVSNSDPEELEKGWLSISIYNPSHIADDFVKKSYTMLECEVFYEPYRVVMEAYQQLNEESFPFKEHILGWTKDPGVPAYLMNPRSTIKAARCDYQITKKDGTCVVIRNVLNIGTWPTAVELGVNPIQRVALHAAMTRRLALIQGPPGTGKTFIGRKIIATLLDNKHMWHDDGNYVVDNARLVAKFDRAKMHRFWERYGDMWRDKRSPIVVICLTNQALDQFLEGVLKVTKKLIRIGNQSQSPLLEGYKMSVLKETIAQDYKKYADSAYWYHKCRMNGLKKCIQDTVDEIRSVAKKLSNLKKSNTGQQHSLASESLNLLKLHQLEQTYRGQILEFNAIRAESEEALCRCVDVVGLTTTGAARRRDLLTLLKPKIVLVEEAAQVLEPHIIASLTASCQHLIMIGDHLQLRPQCNVHKLAHKFHMDVSLFERLVMNNVPSVMLAVQHRMRPEVARLIVPSVYKNLENHESVLKHPAVPSMTRSVFFLDHDHPEAREEGGSSFYNSHEAAMTLRLAHFLCDQGIQQEKITVLVTYAAQMRSLQAHRKEQYKLRSLDRIHITTVDNYQGEENDIIILSLVRNNAIKSVGFLKTPNRVCVALSRARHGLFILGNIRLLAGSGSKLWIHVQKIMIANGELSNELTLRCDRHNQQIVKVKQPENFPMCGIVCKLKCGAILDCGHPCQLPCRNQCHHSVALCQYVEETLLPCGHSIKIPCTINNNNRLPNDEATGTTCVADGCRLISKVNIQVEITKLLVKYSSDENLLNAANSLLKGKSIDEQWKIYQRMYYLCLSATFGKDLVTSYSYTTEDRMSSQVKLNKDWADDLRDSYKAVQDKSLEMQSLAVSQRRWSIQYLTDALFQWRRLDLLRQCLTMLSVEPQSSIGTGCRTLLEEAKILLQNEELGKWTTSQEDDAYALLKLVAAIMRFDLTHPSSGILLGPLFIQPQLPDDCLASFQNLSL